MTDETRLARLRERAQHYRKRAEEETRQRKVSQLRQLAEALEQEAAAITRFRLEEAGAELQPTG